MPGTGLRINAGVAGQEVGQAKTPGVAIQGLLEVSAGDQLVTRNFRAVVPVSGHHQPAFSDLPGVFGIHGIHCCFRIELGQRGVRAEPVAVGRVAGKNRRTAAIRGIVGVPEIDFCKLPTDYGAMPSCLDGSFQTVAGLIEIVLNMQIITTRDSTGGGIQFVVFDSHPAPG